MPIRRKRKSMVRRKRPYRRYRKHRVSRGTRTVMVSRNQSCIPDQMFTKLTYSDLYSVTVGTTSFAYHDWIANSCFDPDNTGIGHQPMGFDQFTNLYQAYRVYGLKYVIEFFPDTSTDYTLLFLRTMPDTNIGSTSDVIRLSELPCLSRRVLGTVGHKGMITLHGYFPMNKVFGMSAKEYSNSPDTSATYTNSPLRKVYLRLYHRLVNETGTSFTLRYRIRFTYYVKMFYRQKLNTS